MNRVVNGNTVGMAPASAAAEKTKSWQLEILMEKLRSKSGQAKTLPEISKNVRMTMLDKRYALDSVEKSQHQKCLDTLQHSIKVTSLQSMIERLESLTRQLGLKFMVGPSGVELFISSDMFYLEIVLDQTGAVKDVKVHHESKMEQQSCAELVNCLSRGDFADFTAQLEGLASIYQLNAEKKIKCKAFTALQSLESDLSNLAQLQLIIKEPFNYIHKTPVGVLEKRRGGHPMRLTYFVSPYDLLNVESCDLDPLSIDTIVAKGLGYSVTVCMEGSATHKLQTTTLIVVNRSVNGKSTPSFAQHNSQNSASIPACFVMKLNKPMPMCVSLVREIQKTTDMDSIDLSQPQPLLNLIVNHSSNGKMESGDNKGLFVTLPDQNHCYFMTENKTMDGILVTSIPFTHPAQVSTIIGLLRRQALFNTIISSCVRPNSKQDFENMTMFEVSALSWTHISISMEHPVEESMATAEIDLSDISGLGCRVLGPGAVAPPSPNAPPDPTSEAGTAVLNRSFSVPITMRAVIKLWEKQAARRTTTNHHQYNNGGHENFSLPLGSGDPGGHKGGPQGGGGGGGLEFGGLDSVKIKQEPSSSGGGGSSGSGSAAQHGMMMMQGQHQQCGGGGTGMFLNESMMANAGFQNFSTSEGMLGNMELSNMLTAGPNQQQLDKSSGGGGTKRHGKRKLGSSEDSWKGGGKRKAAVGDLDASSDLLVETSSSDSTSRSTPISSQEAADVATTPPNSASLGFQSDLELSSSGLDPAELLGPGDKLPAEFGGGGGGLDVELGDVEEMLAGPSASTRRKSRDQKSPTCGLMMDMGEKSLVPPSVSITPIGSTSPGFGQGGNAEKRPGIEIIPLATSAASALPTSITITPIAASQTKGGGGSGEEKSRERKSSKSRSEEKSRDQKKRKRKRDESPMGPPEKVPPKQDPLTKPVTVSIKATTTESPPHPMSTPTSPGMIRKFNAASSSPNRNVLGPAASSGKLSPSPMTKSTTTTTTLKTGGGGSSSSSTTSSSSHHVSPKHSPSHHGGVGSSPKHSSSPKHPSASGSGKPSMSTLKNAANSPSSKSSSSNVESMSKSGKSSGGKESSSSRGGGGEKEGKKGSSGGGGGGASFGGGGGGSGSKIKQSSVKVKPLDLNADLVSSSSNSATSQDGLPSPNSGDGAKSGSANQPRNRKGSLSAIVDKLKSAQHCDGVTDLSSKSKDKGGGGGQIGGSSSSSSKLNDSSNKSNKVGSSSGSDSTKNSEYMVKPSSDGIKLTINKTRSKDSSGTSKSGSTGGSTGGLSSKMGSGSPKTHTGLKPGVNSGPASKKPQHLLAQNQKAGGGNAVNSSSAGGAGAYGAAKAKAAPSSGGSTGGNTGGGSGGTGTGNSAKASSNSSSSSSSSSSVSNKTKLTSSPKATDLSASGGVGAGGRKDRPKLTKSIFTSKDGRKNSPTQQSREEADSLYKQYGTPLMEGLVKQLDTNFQIPKLSARQSDDKKPKTGEGVGGGSNVNNIRGALPTSNMVDSSKIFDMISKGGGGGGGGGGPPDLSKYPLSVPNAAKIFENSLNDSKLRNNTSPSKTKDDDPSKRDQQQQQQQPPNITGGGGAQKSDDPYAKSVGFGYAPSGGNKTFAAPNEPLSLSMTKSMDLSMNAASSGGGGKFVTPAAPKDLDKKDLSTKKGEEGLIDYSSGGGNKEQACKGPYPQSPSVSVHIVKSPAPSPHINPSPHSASPCITDDELMDEALIGLGK